MSFGFIYRSRSRSPAPLAAALAAGILEALDTG
ncbi:MAG: hypothetical protein QOG44_3520 [Acidimicrobiaceae bacterium]|jgi:hypothetical protein|nr:hypothetical protein [Acidimicrobiaceae bacterium]